MRDPFDIIKTARITEKATLLNEKGKYVFDVDTKATKLEIRAAVEKLFKKSVTAVRVMNVKGKWKRTRMGVGRKRSWKKAIVTLKEGEKIELV
jgi:large subunit ribosomal protein L23